MSKKVLEKKIIFDPNTVWKFQSDKIKVFIPEILEKSFNIYCKKSKIKHKQTGCYMYSKESIRKNDLMCGVIREGFDYIMDAKYKICLLKWLKASYKEIKI